VAEAIQMIEDEVAAASIEVDKNAVSHVGKKDIINVDGIRFRRTLTTAIRSPLTR